MKIPTIAIAAVLAFSMLPNSVSAQEIQSIQFARGTSSSTVNGSIKGYDYIDYRIVVRAGQQMSVTMRPTRGSPYFNVMEPRSSDVAIFIGSTRGQTFSGTTAKAGSYTIRVYQMRASARRGEIAGYRLSVAVRGASSSGNIPSHRPGDALVAGTPYHATSIIRCRSAEAMRMSNCKAGVIRRPGSATVHLDTPDGGERSILFRNGRAVASDSENRLSVTRRGDTSVVKIGTVEVYNIPDALIFGG